MTARSTLSERGRRRYRRRKPLPAISALIVLAIAAAVVWVTTVHRSTEQAASVQCTLPKGKSAGRALAPQALDRVSPLGAGQVPVRVLNAAGERGEAGLVTEVLKQLGFAKTMDPGNDTVYANTAMDCRGQIRFGPSGAGAARTLSLLEPCSQLVRDGRRGAGVDLVLGDKFDELRPNDAARKALRQIGEAGSRDGGVRADLLERARDTSTCE